MIGVFPVWLWVFIACMALVVAFVPGVILLDKWLDRRDEKSLAGDDEATVALFERMWQLRHPGWLATRLRLQLAALHALIPAVQLLHHQLPVASPPGPGNAPHPGTDGAGAAVPAPGPGAGPWRQVLPPVPHEHDEALWGAGVAAAAPWQGDAGDDDGPWWLHDTGWFTLQAIDEDIAARERAS